MWGVLRGGWLLLRKPRSVKPLREAALCLFAVFMAGVLCMALDGKWQSPAAMLQSAWQRLQTGDKIHLTPMHTIGPQLASLPKLTSLTQLPRNILLFSPWGFCLPLLWPRYRKPLRLVGMALLLTCLIEFTQLFIDRFVEFDDLLLTFLGAMLGAALWRLMHRRFPQADALFLAP